MEGKTVGARSREWLTSLNKKDTNSDSRKYQTTARFSEPIFRELQRRAKENGNSLAKEIRKATRKGLKEVEKDE